MSSKARGLNLYAASHLPVDHPKRKRKYINGDVNTCLIRTVNGVSISLTHDTDSPRPYSRINLVQGTKGIVSGWPQMAVSLEILGNPHPAWETGDKYRTQYQSTLRTHAKEVHAKLPGITKDFGRILEGAVWHYAPDHDVRDGDFLEDYRLVEAIRGSVAPDFDVDDAATWSSIAVLSEESVANRSRPVDFPDFTKGKWKSNPRIDLAET